MNKLEQLSILQSLLSTFVHGPNRSLKAAGQIEVMLEEIFPDDAQLQDYVTDFASYRPEGGDYLFDEAQMVAKSKELLALIEKRKGLTE